MSLAYAVRDASTMLRRNVLHARRYPALSFGAVLLPLIFLLLFVYVLGGTLGAGITSGVAPGAAGRAAYLAYVTPGILVLSIASGTVTTAVAVNTDLTEGIVARFRTMAITRSALLVGHVVGSVVLTVAGTVLVLGVAVVLGFRPATGLVGWLAVLGLTALVALALTWLAVALGAGSRTPEAASNVVLPLVFLPFLGTTFVPAESLPLVLRGFARYQPFTPVIETLRHLLAAQPVGVAGLVAVAWCVGLGVVGWLWARVAFQRAAVR
jgi:ABC-2 type transport system permease protein